MTNTPDTQIEDRPFSRGSVWRKWDLHLHSLSSFDYDDKSVTDAEMIQTLTGSGIAAAVICDHHRIDVDRFKSLKALAGDKLALFPGIELRTQLGGKESVHMAGIFSERADLDHIWITLQGKLGLTDTEVKSKGDESIYVDFVQAAKVIHQLGGLVSVHAGKKTNTIENISNAEIFKQAVKEDLAREHLDIFEIGRPEDAADYEGIVFPDIKKVFPLVIGSDNHNIRKYSPKLPTWVRSDPTFEGLHQILVEPHDRVYRGDIPPLLQRVSQNKTKYIDKVSIKKEPDSTLKETWFDCSVPLNPGLVAIIGNKGGGKSALSDTLGLLGDTRNDQSFSFLNKEKFRQPKNNKARHFHAELRWESGTPAGKNLDDDIDSTAVEMVKYIPQNYLENICNELRDGGETRFDAELKSVIFSHVQLADRLHAESLDDLIQYKTEEINQAIEILRSELSEINEQIASFEGMLAESYKKSLEAELAEKKRELESHDASKPSPVIKPELDPAKHEEATKLSKTIEEIQGQIASLNKERSNLIEEQTVVIRRAAAATKLLGKIENLKKQHQVFKAESASEFNELGISVEDTVKLIIDTFPITELQGTLNARNEQIRLEFDPQNASGIAAKIAAQESALEQQKSMLDAPNQEYHAYLAKLTAWETKRNEILGDEKSSGTLNFLQDRLTRIETVPMVLFELREQRKQKSNEIFSQIESLGTLYKNLYKPVQDFIEHHPLAKEGFQLDFRVSIVDIGFENGFFARINQQKKGSFCGTEEGHQMLKSLLEKTEWNSSADTFAFIEDLLLRLSNDYRHDKRPKVRVEEQLKKEVSVAELYDYLFSFEYLKPRYNLQWDGRDLDELSPGERGTVLLLFYLLLDSSYIPLVIDQPEENLDNQTVFSILVPAIKEARTRRQIIIVTHNPNLAVVCDADQVIYAELDKLNGNKVTYECGAIEDPIINKRIIDVLEGTRPAFDNRDDKYQERKCAT